MDMSATFRLLQTKGYYARHRPCYVVASTTPTKLQRLSTEIRDYFPEDTSNKIDLFTMSWSEGAVPQGAQMLRFHLFTSMPGAVDNSIALSALDYDIIKAVIYDMRTKVEWGKFALTTAGDGTVDPNLGEECDPLSVPPYYITYDANTSGTISD